MSQQPLSKASATSKNTNARNTSKGAATTTTTTSTDGVGGAVTVKRAPAGNKVKQVSQRTSEAEKKRLKKELDKLMKAHKRASKALDDFRNEKIESR